MLLIGDQGYASFYQWMIKAYGFTDEQRQPYTFNPAPFIADENSGMQGYLSSEPLMVEKEGGFKPDVWLIADAGYSTYSTADRDDGRHRSPASPSQVKCFVDGSIKGWYNYLYGDNTAANALIKKDNPDMTDEQIAFGIEKMKESGHRRFGRCADDGDRRDDRGQGEGLLRQDGRGGCRAGRSGLEGVVHHGTSWARASGMDLKQVTVTARAAGTRRPAPRRSHADDRTPPDPAPWPAPPRAGDAGRGQDLQRRGDGAAEDVAAVNEGDFISLLGPSGCGKSTALRLISGLMPPTAGRIVWEGGEHAGDLGMVFQEPTLMPWATVAQNVWLPFRLRGQSFAVGRGARSWRRCRWSGLRTFAGAYPRELSGGMKMRVSIARAMVTNPRLILMDEPFAALDEITRQKLNNDLLALKAKIGCTVIFVTHSVFESVFLSDRVVVMAARPGPGDRRVDGRRALSPRHGVPHLARLCGRSAAWPRTR